MYENAHEKMKNKIGIDVEGFRHSVKVAADAFTKIFEVFIKIFQPIVAVSPEKSNKFISPIPFKEGIDSTFKKSKPKSYKNNFFDELDVKVHGLIQPSIDELVKAKKLYDKLKNKGEISFDFPDFYRIWGVEIQKLNINKIDCLDKLVAKVHGYKKYRRKLILSGKVKKCINCCFRMGSKKHIGRCAVRPVLDDKKEFDYFTSVHDEYRCDLWYSKYPEDNAKKFVTKVFDDLASSEEEDDHIGI